MAAGHVSLRVQGGLQLHSLVADLKKAERADLSRKMRRNVRTAAKPVIADVRSAVLGIHMSPPRKGPAGHTGLRARAGNALTTSITGKGVRILVSARKFGDYGTTLPKYMDGEMPGYGRWRHPVYGNTNVWADQKGQPWFFVTIRQHATDFRKAVLAALDEIIDILAG